MRANWKRGAFRTWVLVSACWAIATLFLMSSDLLAVFPSHHIVYVKMSNTQTLQYPNELGVDGITKDLKKRIDAANVEDKRWAADMAAPRKAQCAALPPSTPLDKLPDDCLKLLMATTSDIAVPVGWETQVTSPRPFVTTVLEVLMAVIVPPSVVFTIGLALAWVFAGFRPT
jgi:hypothetical protein